MGIEFAPAVCPECGLAFDPDDSSTTSPFVKPSIMARLTWWNVAPLVVILAVAAGIVHTVIPRPENLADWRLWVWMHQKYGIETKWISGNRAHIHWWGDRMTSVRTVNSTGDPLWEVSWQWPDQWVIRAHREGVRQRDLVDTFTQMKQEMFGVMIAGAAKDVTDAPVEFVGSKVDVFSNLVAHFGIQVTPFLMRKHQQHVWIFDHELERMTAVDPVKAESMGFSVQLWRGGERSEPLIAPESGSALTHRPGALPNAPGSP